MKKHTIIFTVVLALIFIIFMASGISKAFKIFDSVMFRDTLKSVGDFVLGKPLPSRNPSLHTEISTSTATTPTEFQSTQKDDMRLTRAPEFSFPVALPPHALRTAAILDVPLPKNIHCMSETYANEPECYNAHHYALNQPHKCALYVNPVSDAAGFAYPSACWAEELGAASFDYGYSERMTQFLRDLWLTPRMWRDHGVSSGYKSFNVPMPHAEFSFGNYGWQKNRRLLSMLWTDRRTEMIVDYSYDPYKQKHTASIEIKKANLPVHGERIHMILAFVLFDNAYPEKVLLDAGKYLEASLNDYFRKNQQVPEPLQVDVTPVVIDPPVNVPKPNEGANNWYENEIYANVREAVIRKTGVGEFKILAIAPVFVDPGGKNVGPAGGGGVSSIKEQVIKFFINPPVAYSETDIRSGLLAFQYLPMGVVRHELLHVLGWGAGATHDPMDGIDYRTDLQTGRENPQGGLSMCDTYHAYVMELPATLRLRVGEEPSWFRKVLGKSGTCLSETELESFLIPPPRIVIGNLIDVDNDGVYEQVYGQSGIPADIALTRSMGWRDLDGDGVGEVADPDPYGGFQEVLIPAHSGAKLTKLLSFKSLGSTEIEGCRFERILLDDGEEGLLPLQCVEFNNEIVNVYKNMEYLWLKVPKNYGLILLPRFSTRVDYY